MSNTDTPTAATKSAPKTYTKEEFVQLLNLLRGGVTKAQAASALGRPETAMQAMRKRLNSIPSLEGKVPSFKVVRTGGFRKASLTDDDLGAFLSEQEDEGNLAHFESTDAVDSDVTEEEEV